MARPANARGRLSQPARYSLRVRLMLTLTAALLPILVISAIQAVNDAQNSRDVRRQQLIVLTDAAVDRVEKSIDAAELLLDVYAEDIASGDCKGVLAKVQSHVPAASNVLTFDTTGTSRCVAVGDAGQLMSNLDWNEAVLAGQTSFRTPTFYGRLSKAWIFSVFRRNEGPEGEFTGSSAISLRAAELVTPLRGNLQLDGLEVAIASPDGQVFGSARFEEIPAAWIDSIETSRRSELFTTKRDDQALDVAVSELGADKLYAVLSRPSPPVMSSAVLKPFSSFGIPLLAFSVTLLAAWLAIDGLVLKWLRRIGRFAQIYADGNYQPQDRATVRNAPTEIANLASSLDNMASAVSQRERELTEAVSLRDAAVKEIHHRVKNNLQIVSSFLNLEARAAQTDETRRVVENARNRISALSIVHQTLYQYERLDSVEMRPFLDGLLKHLEDALGMADAGVNLEWEVDNVVRDSDDAIPMALLLLELITNAMKHAFDERGGTISVTLAQEGEQLKLSVRDDGQGKVEAPEEESQAVSGLGSRLVKAFARQLGGEPVYESVPGKGYAFQMAIPMEMQ